MQLPASKAYLRLVSYFRERLVTDQLTDLISDLPMFQSDGSYCQGRRPMSYVELHRIMLDVVDVINKKSFLKSDDLQILDHEGEHFTFDKILEQLCIFSISQPAQS